jgi:hypothetical protein
MIGSVASAAVACVIYRDIDAAEMRDSLFDGSGHLCNIGHVKRNEDQIIACNIA